MTKSLQYKNKKKIEIDLLMNPISWQLIAISLFDLILVNIVSFQSKGKQQMRRTKSKIFVYLIKIITKIYFIMKNCTKCRGSGDEVNHRENISHIKIKLPKFVQNLCHTFRKDLLFFYIMSTIYL